MQPYPRRLIELLFTLTDHDIIVIRHASDDGTIVYAVLAQDSTHFIQIVRLHLDHGTQFLGK